MRKKIAFVLAMLIALTASLSAQVAYVSSFFHTYNLSEQKFIEVYSKVNQNTARKFNLIEINKLPTSIIQVINNSLRNYNLDIGDVFEALVIYQEAGYHVTLRITDTKKYYWQFFALLQFP